MRMASALLMTFALAACGDGVDRDADHSNAIAAGAKNVSKAAEAEVDQAIEKLGPVEPAFADATNSSDAAPEAENKSTP